MVSLLAVGLWLVVIAAVAWMVHSTPDSNRSIRRFRRARRSLAPQGRRHRAAAAAASEPSTVVVMARPPRRPKADRIIDLRERDPEPGPAHWPADGWSLGSLAPSGPRIAWATAGATPWGRNDAPREPGRRPAQYERREPRADTARATQPARGTRPAPAAGRTARPAAPLPAPRRPVTAASRPVIGASRPAVAESRPRAARPSVASPAATYRPATPRQAGPRPAPQPLASRPAPQLRPAGAHPAPKTGARPAPKEPTRRINFDERPHHAAVSRGARQARQADGSARWRVIDLTDPPRRTNLAAGAEAQGEPGPLPDVFRLDPLHKGGEAASRHR